MSRIFSLLDSYKIHAQNYQFARLIPGICRSNYAPTNLAGFMSSLGEGRKDSLECLSTSCRGHSPLHPEVQKWLLLIGPVVNNFSKHGVLETVEETQLRHSDVDEPISSRALIHQKETGVIATCWLWRKRRR